MLNTYTGWAKKWTNLSIDNLTTVSGVKECDMPKVSQCCIEKA